MSKKDKETLMRREPILLELNLIMKETHQKAFRCKICNTLLYFNDMEHVCMCCGIGICLKCVGGEN
ncbi:MAG TPA: hypothetical protein ENI29_21765 [bacterium]|nr:hypothetical protein [bacterium]